MNGTTTPTLTSEMKRDRNRKNGFHSTMVHTNKLEKSRLYLKRIQTVKGESTEEGKGI